MASLIEAGIVCLLRDNRTDRDTDAETVIDLMFSVAAGGFQGPACRRGHERRHDTKAEVNGTMGAAHESWTARIGPGTAVHQENGCIMSQARPPARTARLRAPGRGQTSTGPGWQRKPERTSPQEDATASVAALVEPLVEALIGRPPVRIEFWDGSAIDPPSNTTIGTVQVRCQDALRRILWAPGELGVGRAFVAGDVDFDGDIFELIAALRPAGQRLRHELAAVPAVVRTALRVGALARPLPPPPEEAPARWLGRHSKRRDASAISHHYDVGNDFYQLVLGESMTYSCARFVQPTDTLAQAQTAKHELISRKLGLHRRPGIRLLDVGCGWGTMAIHAARTHNAEVVGITISREQADAARSRVSAAGVDDRVEIRLQDYRDLAGERFDAISSIGMFEHVGHRRMAEYFSTLHEALVPGGRLLNHAISSVGGSKVPTRSFVYRYVFPDGELLDVGDVALAMETAGFEVRDVESLREHYTRTLRYWTHNLQQYWDHAVEQVGEGRARVWLLYMAASTVGFNDGGISIHQVLGAVPDSDGNSHMPSTRRDWE